MVAAAWVLSDAWAGLRGLVSAETLALTLVQIGGHV
jgi:hypothetical protein